MNRELTLEELQKKGLEILKEVHSFCEENNIIRCHSPQRIHPVGR